MDLLKSRPLNDWPLFYRIAALNSAAVIAYLPPQDLSGPQGVSEMIQCWGRCCVSFLYLAFAASSINVLRGRVLEHPSVSVDAPAGSLVIRDAQAWHRSGTNRIDAMRLMLSVVYSRTEPAGEESS